VSDELAESPDATSDTADAADGWDDTADDAADVWDESEPEVAAEAGAADVIRPEPTGVPTVDAAVERLAELDDLPTGEHVAIYDAVHRQLQDALADLDGA
jgi:hypothetical protein